MHSLVPFLEYCCTLLKNYQLSNSAHCVDWNNPYSSQWKPLPWRFESGFLIPIHLDPGQAWTLGNLEYHFRNLIKYFESPFRSHHELLLQKHFSSVQNSWIKRQQSNDKNSSSKNWETNTPIDKKISFTWLIKPLWASAWIWSMTSLFVQDTQSILKDSLAPFHLCSPIYPSTNVYFPL